MNSNDFRLLVNDYKKSLALNDEDSFRTRMNNRGFYLSEGTTKMCFYDDTHQFVLKFNKFCSLNKKAIENEYTWFIKSNLCFPKVFHYDESGMSMCSEYCNCNRKDVIQKFKETYGMFFYDDRSLFLGLKAAQQISSLNQNFDVFDDVFNNLYEKVIKIWGQKQQVSNDQIKQFVKQILSKNTVQDVIFYQLYEIYFKTSKYLLDLISFNFGITKRFDQNVLIITDASF